MKNYEQLVKEFFTRYRKPFVDKLTIGFSDIDPPLKVNPAEIDHEALDGLLAPNTNEHYHLTKEQHDKLIKLIDGDNFPPLIYPNQVIRITADEPMTGYEIQGKNLRQER